MTLDPQYHLPPGRPGIKAVPKWYKDTHFRSTLEADWAAMFDTLGWFWEYEPEAVELPDGTRYRPDFRLPAQKVWCEVKGPHNERLEKAVALQDALHYDEFEWGNDLVVILRPPGGGEYAQWEGTRDSQEFVIVLCPECEHYCFMDFAGTWSCRHHLRKRKEPNKFWLAEGGDLFRPGEMRFTRAPHPDRTGAW